MKTKKEPLTKEIIIKALERMVENKAAIRKYLRGELGMEELVKRGIKFERPI